jgi:uncharacterized protein (TIGR02171 family)
MKKQVVQTMIFSFFIAVWFDCSLPTKVADNSNKDVPLSMKRNFSLGKAFMLGTNDTLAPADERPATTVSLTYDYYIDISEVTQGEYENLMGVVPEGISLQLGAGDNYPVYFVSWYDAVLFCNARSKKQNLDTVYSYQAMIKSASGVVTELVGVQTGFGIDGYRLPTEAEWEFAARGGDTRIQQIDSTTVGSQAWYSGNSGGKTHEVKLLKPNALGLYDMAGNVYEWTNDWKGPFSSRTTTNAIGAKDPDPDFEKVIKGGSFLHGLQMLNFSRRSSTYPTSLSSKSCYVGFRCARGTIPAPSYYSTDSVGNVLNSVNMVLSSMQPYLGTSRAKLVFVNVSGLFRTLCVIDYSASIPWVKEFTDYASVYNPTISPNGKLVAFCSRNEGSAGSAEVYMRNLDQINSVLKKMPATSAYVPRWWVDQATKDTFIIYTNSTVDNQQADWTATKTYMQKVVADSFAGSPVELATNGSYHDGRSYDGTFICSGSTQAIMKNLVSGESKTLFTSPQNGKPAGMASQVCNMSIAPDSISTGRCLFLDLGCPVKSTITNDAYAGHQYLFASNFSGNIETFYKCPPNEVTWEYPEWSTHPDFAVSCCADASEETKRIYLIPLKNNQSSIKLVEGVELVHPYLWCDIQQFTGTGLAMDSLGHYNDPGPQDYCTRGFASRLHAFWQEYSKFRAVFVGSSHTEYAIDPPTFKYPGVYNMGFSAEKLQDQLDLVYHYILGNCSSVNVVGLDVLLGHLASTTRYVSIEKSIGYQYDKSHEFWKQGLPDNFQQLVNAVPWDTMSGFMGYLGRGRSVPGNWGGPNPPIDLGAEGVPPLSWDTSLVAYKQNVEAIWLLAEVLKARKIHLLLYITPESPYYKNTQSYTHYGPRRDVAASIIEQLKSLTVDNPYCHFYNAHNGGDHDYTDQDAFDYDHLSLSGAQKFSARLDSILFTFTSP